MKKIILLFISFIWLSDVSAQNFNLSNPVPFDTAVRTGTLPNGMKYYIRKNAKPEHRAELRLVVNAGSILETDNQQGLAHFCEHMCFNGTKNFPKSALVDYLESVGMNFGADLNAYTSFDETVYMLQIPTDTPAIFEKGMQILGDWAHNVTFDDGEINKERGVVVEEWRLGQGAQERMLRKWFPVVFQNSMYANRLPIGKKEIIETAPYDTIKKFYKDWYRPDLMAVVAVGDFDVDAVEKMIKEEFSILVNPAGEKYRTLFPVPDNDELNAVVCKDKEATGTVIEVMYKLPLSSSKTVGDYRQHCVEQMFTMMLNNRYNELMQKPNPPFSYATSDKSELVRTKEVYMSLALVPEDGVERGLKTLIDENNRVKKFGFTPGEFDRAKKDMLSYLETMVNEKDKTDSKSYTREYVSNYLTGEPSPGIEWENAMWKQTLSSLKIEEINQLATTWISENGKNCTIVVLAPEKEGVEIPSEETIKQIYLNQQNEPVTPYSDIVIKKPLMKKKPKAGKVVSEKTIADYNITEWTLSNGAKVVLKPTDFKNDQILFSAYSFGGSSLYPDKDDVSASYATEVVSKSGLGPFDAVTLNKYLSGKIASIQSSIGATTETFSGSATPKDVETLFQMLYLYQTSSKCDSNGFKSLLAQEKSSIQNRSNSPQSALFDSVALIMHSYNVRYRPVTLATLNELDMNRACEIYKDRFSNPGEFTYFFVGSFNLSDIKPLVEAYIGGIPSTGRIETYKDLGIHPPKGTINKEIVKGTDPKSTVYMIFSGPFEYNRQNRMEVSALIELVNIELRETLREDMGGVYGVSAFPRLQHYPTQEYQMGIYFSCSPDNRDALISAALKVLDSIKVQGCNEERLLKVKELMFKEREKNLKENNFWLSALSSSYQNNENILELKDFNNQVSSFTSDDFKKWTIKYYNPTNFAKFVLNPEKKEP